MTRLVQDYRRWQVFLNYPYDDAYAPLGTALTYAVAAAGLIPVSAKDFSSPDGLRLTLLIELVSNCQYSIHDLSRCKGEGEENLARMNMPLEMGMAIYHAIATKQQGHRCAFFVRDAASY